MDDMSICLWYAMYILSISYEYNINVICTWVYTQCKSAATIYFHHTSVYSMYIPCTWHTLVYTFHITYITCTSCFQGFVALIVHTCRPIRTPLTTCQTYMMRLILHKRVFFAWGLPMVLALTSGGAAMFTTSTPGCGTLDGSSLAWEASLWPKLRRKEVQVWGFQARMGN